MEGRYIGRGSVSSVLAGAWYSLRLSLLTKALMSLIRVYSFGGGGVGQKFKAFCNKLVSDWVSFNDDKLTILLLRISAFVIVSLFFLLFVFLYSWFGSVPKSHDK